MYAASYQSGLTVAGEASVLLTPKNYPASPLPAMHYVHGSGYVSDYILDPLCGMAGIDLANDGFVGLSADNGPAGLTNNWGNDVAVDRLTRNVATLSGVRGAHPSKYSMYGISMGASNALVYAAQATVKPRAMVLIIPVINVEDIRANNRGGLASAIDAAYGGAYVENVSGPDKNPAWFKSSNKILGIPMLIFYGTSDVLCLPSWTEEFASKDPSFRTLVPLSGGHALTTQVQASTSLISAFLKANQ